MGDYLLNTALSLNPIETLQLGIYHKMYIIYVCTVHRLDFCSRLC